MRDLLLVDARTAWNEKVMSLNFPKSVFLEEPKAVKEHTLNILRE